jgi:phage terminase large subunit-like protein
MDQDEDETRRHYQFLYQEIPKKNGKTELSAALGLYHLLGDGEANGEIYICAADKENASKCFNAMVTMIDSAPWLGKLVKVVPSRKEIRSRQDRSYIRVLSAEAYSKHGYNVSCCIFDELHTQPNRDLWDVMTYGAGDARRQPVWIVLTTAGDDPDRHSIGWEIHSNCRRILAARAGEGPEADDDPIWLPVMYGLPDEPEALENIDIYDEAVWHKCNPSLGVTVSMRTMRQEAREAKKSEAKERLFRWLRLNQWIATKAVGWIPLTIYDRTQWNPLGAGADWREAVKLLEGMTCYGGLDLSSTTDLTAFVLLFPPQDGLETWVALFQAWTAGDGIQDREKRDHVPYRDWEKADFIHICDGDIIDYTQVERCIQQAAEKYDLRLLGVDPYLSRTITQRLMNWEAPMGSCTERISVVDIPQTIVHLSPAMKEMERLIRKHEMLHIHNTCARWNFGNIRCYVDGNENIKPMKNKSVGRIDITVAWIIAMATALLQVNTDTGLSEAMEDGTFSL